MITESQTTCTAFQGERRIASGTLREVAQKAKAVLDLSGSVAVLIFDNATSHQIEVDFRGTMADVLKRLSALAEPSAEPMAADLPAARAARPGRPKLGVVAREVTLLPRHWEWLSSQPGGASVALRKLVEEARLDRSGKDRIRRSQEAANRFMSVMAGDRPGFEEATRALFAGDRERFGEQTAAWPADIRNHARILAADAM